MEYTRIRGNSQWLGLLDIMITHNAMFCKLQQSLFAGNLKVDLSQLASQRRLHQQIMIFLNCPMLHTVLSFSITMTQKNNDSSHTRIFMETHQASFTSKCLFICLANVENAERSSNMMQEHTLARTSLKHMKFSCQISQLVFTMRCGCWSLLVKQ